MPFYQLRGTVDARRKVSEVLAVSPNPFINVRRSYVWASFGHCWSIALRPYQEKRVRLERRLYYNYDQVGDITSAS